MKIIFWRIAKIGGGESIRSIGPNLKAEVLIAAQLLKDFDVLGACRLKHAGKGPVVRNLEQAEFLIDRKAVRIGSVMPLDHVIDQNNISVTPPRTGVRDIADKTPGRAQAAYPKDFELPLAVKAHRYRAEVGLVS